MVLLSIHGIIRPEHLEWVRLLGHAVIRFVGSSSHGPAILITQAIDSSTRKTYPSMT